MGNGRSRLGNSTGTARSSKSYTEIMRGADSTKFTATPVGRPGSWDYTHSYGDSAEVLEYFSKYTNINSLLSHISQDERDLFSGWAVGDFMGKSGETWDDLSTYRQEIVQVIDKYADKVVFKEGIEVKMLAGYGVLTGSRAVPSEAEWANIEGRPIKFELPRSAAAANEGLIISGRGKNVEYTYKIPANTPGVALPFMHRRINGEWHELQREVIMARDTFWKPSKRKYNKSRGVWEITMTYVGKDRHYYGR